MFPTIRSLDLYIQVPELPHAYDVLLDQGTGKGLSFAYMEPELPFKSLFDRQQCDPACNELSWVPYLCYYKPPAYNVYKGPW